MFKLVLEKAEEGPRDQIANIFYKLLISCKEKNSVIILKNLVDTILTRWLIYHQYLSSINTSQQTCAFWCGTWRSIQPCFQAIPSKMHNLTLTTTKLVEVMLFQLSYFRSWKMMLWKCSTQYASKFGKLRCGHRTGKGLLLFKSQSQAMTKNGQTTIQLHLSHMLAK